MADTAPTAVGRHFFVIRQPAPEPRNAAKGRAARQVRPIAAWSTNCLAIDQAAAALCCAGVKRSVQTTKPLVHLFADGHSSQPTGLFVYYESTTNIEWLYSTRQPPPCVR